MWHLIEAVIILALCDGAFRLGDDPSQGQAQRFRQPRGRGRRDCTPRGDRCGCAGRLEALTRIAAVIFTPAAIATPLGVFRGNTLGNGSGRRRQAAPTP